MRNASFGTLGCGDQTSGREGVIQEYNIVSGFAWEFVLVLGSKEGRKSD